MYAVDKSFRTERYDVDWTHTEPKLEKHLTHYNIIGRAEISVQK